MRASCLCEGFLPFSVSFLGNFLDAVFCVRFLLYFELLAFVRVRVRVMELGLCTSLLVQPMILKKVLNPA